MPRYRNLVSIIMPCYNAEQFLESAILSVIGQDLQDWELLICDDGSADLSKEIMEKWSERDARIKVLENRYDIGAAGARNTSLDVACGRYIAFLDADDIWHPSKLKKQIQHMKATGSSFCLSYYDVMDEAGEYCYTMKTPSVITYRHMMYSNFIPCLTAVYDSAAIGKVKQPNIKKRNDYALWLTLFRERGVVSATAVCESLASYRQNNYGLSSSGLDALRYYYVCLRKYAGRTLFSSIYFSSLYLAIVLIKKIAPKIYNYVVSSL
jgi:teichuronic acid biosynthesis glycosyltransferase TuaG